MRREDLEHVVHAAATITKERELVVVGSQAILGAFPDAPPSLLRSIEADLYPLGNPAKSDEIDGNLGDGSPFHEQYGYYAHGVGPETVKAPAGWERRLIRVRVDPRPASSVEATALCLEPHDLVLAKCARGEPRDWDFAAEALRAGIVGIARLTDAIDDMPVGDEARVHIRRMLSARARGG